jgi:hypothetical protein
VSGQGLDSTQSNDNIYIPYITAIGLTPGGSNTSHIYTQTIHIIQRIFGKCGPCPVFASCTLVFALQLRKKHRKPSVRVAQYKDNKQYNTQKKNSSTHKKTVVHKRKTVIHRRKT